MSRFSDEDRERILAEARANIAADFSTPDRDTLHYATHGNTDDVLTQWEKLKPKPQPPQPQSKLDTIPVAWSAEIARQVAIERRFIFDVVAQCLKKELGDNEKFSPKSTRASIKPLGFCNSITPTPNAKKNALAMWSTGR